jgi:glycosyltransferase involved in cell wall biosynthesis
LETDRAVGGRHSKICRLGGEAELIKVAFWFDRPAQYSGGLNYLRNLLFALSCVEGSDIQAYIFFGKSVSADLVRPFERLAIVVRTSVLDRKSVAWFAHQILHRIFGSMLMVERALRPFQISIVSHAAGLFGRLRRFRIICWIPDFQYLHLPELFPHDTKEGTRRLLKLVAGSDALVLSSLAALSDFRQISEGAVGTSVVVLPFVSQSSVAGSQSQEAASILVKYDIRGRYFFMPNQFWKHKNHAVVFRAVKELKARGISVVVVCSGNLRDYRVKDYDYVDNLMRFIKENQLADNVRILGQIDYSDVLCLMRQSVSVINPSRFEGWSSTVEEARSIGQRLILSSIPVHIEQNPGNARYFKPDDHLELADLMASQWSDGSIGVSEERARRAAAELRERTLAFGRAYERLVLAVNDDLLEKRIYTNPDQLPTPREKGPRAG